MKKRTCLFLALFSIFSLRVKGQASISRETVQSLFIETYCNNQKIGSATGFVIKSKTQYYLITNWHVVTNKNPVTKNWLDINTPNQMSPNKIIIYFSSKQLGKTTIREEILSDNSGIRYKEYMIGKEMADVVALPLKDTLGNIKLFPVDYSGKHDSIILTPTERVFVLGFPKGRRSGLTACFPIWKSGLIASEPYLDEDNKPIMWIDADTHPGMSGSPVYFISNSPIIRSDGVIMPPMRFFMGIFSYTLTDINVGALWKAAYLKQLFDLLP